METVESYVSGGEMYELADFQKVNAANVVAEQIRKHHILGAGCGKWVAANKKTGRSGPVNATFAICRI